jgi:hypothetical protein
MRNLILSSAKGVAFGVLAGALWLAQPAGVRAAGALLCPGVATQQVSATRGTCSNTGTACTTTADCPITDSTLPNVCRGATQAFTKTFTGFTLVNGACTNFGTGTDPTGASGAALASQALSELSQSTTQETARSAENSIVNRREAEEQRCAEGFRRVDGACEPIAAPAAAAAPPPPPPPEKPAAVKKAKKGKAAVVAKAPPPPPPAPPPAPVPHPPVLVSKEGAPPVLVEAPFRYGVWGQVYGEYEKRNATGPGAITGNDFAIISQGQFVPLGAGFTVPLDISAQSQSGTIGFQAGLDLTTRGFIRPDDGLIAGILVGYLSNNLTLNTQSFSTNLDIVGNDFTHLTARLSGPTLGIYATYFSGPFSADILAKFDILSLNQSFTENAALAGPFGPFSGTLSSGGSTSVLNSTVAANLNYRFDLYPNLWIQPTVGAEFTGLGYGGGAADLGLENGTVVMIQGGARIGTTSVFTNNVLMTATLTGLAYDDVLVSGGFIPGAAFQGNNILANADRGQVRGRGILALNFDFGQGLTSFVQGDVHGGQGLFGAGGKAGIRYQW